MLGLGLSISKPVVVDNGGGGTPENAWINPETGDAWINPETGEPWTNPEAE